MIPEIIKFEKIGYVKGHCGNVKRLLDHRKTDKVNFDLVEIKNALRHYHKKSTEYYFVVEGSGILELGDEKYIIKKGDLAACNASR